MMYFVNDVFGVFVQLSTVLWRLSEADDDQRVTSLVSQLTRQFAASSRWSHRQMYDSVF